MNSDAFDCRARCRRAKRLTSEFLRDVSLPPNVTRIDLIACDALADRASVRQFDVAPGKR